MPNFFSSFFRSIPAASRFATMVAVGTAASGLAAATPPTAVTPYRADQIAPAIDLVDASVSLHRLPARLQLHSALGVVTARPLEARRIHLSARHVYECRATLTPKGELLLMFPEGEHYRGKTDKQNEMIAYRSADGGRTWAGPSTPMARLDYNHHGFIPLVSARQPGRIHSFGTQAVWSLWDPAAKARDEDAPIGWLYSDDDGLTWQGPEIIRPVNDPEFRGMSVVRMTETPRGTWLLGSHAADWSQRPLQTWQYLLRSTDRGANWTVLPAARPGGWQCPGFGRMDETTLVSLGGDEVFALSRTPEGRLWSMRSLDDGLTWSEPAPTPLVHPDAPAMMFLLPDGHTLAVLHHNRSSNTHLSIAERAHLGADNPGQRDRAQLWISLSTDGGRSWDEPRFLLANALLPFEANAWFNYQCSYADLVAHDGRLHLFLPHRWRQILHFTFESADLARLPTARELAP